MSEWILGSNLRPEVQRECLNRFVHRFTGDHKPAWANKLREDGTPYPLQFVNDADWLAHTEFCINRDGSLNRRVGYCTSSPTWPNNPELRKS